MAYRSYAVIVGFIAVVLVGNTDAGEAFVPISYTSADTLSRVLKNTPGSKDKITLYLQYGEKFLRANPDSARYYYEKAHELAIRLKDKPGLSQYISHDLKLLNDKGKYEEALALSNQMISIGRDLNDTTIMVKGYNDVANDYEYLGDLQNATKYYVTALRLADRLGNDRMRQKLNNNIASVFIELKDYAQGNIYAGRSLQMSTADKDTAEMGSSLINLGITEMHLEKYNLALKHFDRTILISKIVHDPTLAGDARINKGDVFMRQHNFKLARLSYLRVQKMALKYDLPYYNLYALFSLAGVDKQERNYSRAATYTRQAIAIGERLGAREELREMYDTLSVILEKTGDIGGALVYRKKYEILNDSTMGDRVRTNINRLQIQYRAAQKDKEIAEQNLRIQESNATIERKNFLLLLSAIGILLLLVFVALIYRFYLQRQKLQEQRILNLQKEREVVRLKAVMKGKDEERRRISAEMHDDIGSALTTIMYLSENLKGNDKETRTRTINKISEAAGAVVDKMNEIIWSMNKDYDTLEDLVTYIRYNTVELLEDNGLGYKFKMPSQIPDISIGGEKRRNVYLVVKEALHNIIKHANATEVVIEFSIGDELEIRICDNGKGINNGNSRKFGNGLKNMKYRMETIGGRFGVDCDHGTTVSVNVPLNSELRMSTPSDT